MKYILTAFFLIILFFFSTSSSYAEEAPVAYYNPNTFQLIFTPPQDAYSGWVVMEASPNGIDQYGFNGGEDGVIFWAGPNTPVPEGTIFVYLPPGEIFSFTDPITGQFISTPPTAYCSAVGATCTSGSNCCSRSCNGPQVPFCSGGFCSYRNTCSAPVPTSAPTPTVIPGCHASGGTCSANNECCSNSCEPQPESCFPDGLGGQTCSPNPGICNAAAPTPTTAPSTVTIQGRFVDATGATMATNIGQSVTINGSPPVFQNSSIFWSNGLATNTYTVIANVPSGYILSYSSCINCTAHATYTSGNSASVTLSSNGNYADIYFKYTPNVCTTTFSGSIIVNPTSTNCASPGGSAYTGAGQVSAYNGSSPASQQVAVSTGAYSSLSYGPTCGSSSFITLSGVPYTVTGVCDNGVYSTQNGYTYPYTNTGQASVSRTVTFLVASQGAWYQVDTGDVRFPSLTNPIPGGLSASVAGSSLFASSTGTVSLGAGVLPPATNWQVNQEYSYNNDFASGLGSMSYTFYLSRAKQRNVTINAATSPLNLTTTASGVYQTNGDLSVSGSVTGGKHIVLLVGGTATVTGNISVPTGSSNLFVLAAKGGLTFSSAVGTSPATSTTASVEGYYTSEGNILLSGLNNCGSGTDLRLNVGGALVANSLHPFAGNGQGKIIVNRNICAGSSANPTYYVKPRPDLLLQMTDFYKIPYKTFREVNP